MQDEQEQELIMSQLSHLIREFEEQGYKKHNIIHALEWILHAVNFKGINGKKETN